jgi:tetratricopeptide (TPR) repeat protein
VALAEGVELLVQRRLLREMDGGAGFDFSHDRIREVVHADLGAARRIVLHRHAADALQSAGAEDHALIAGHCELAQQWDAAIAHFERAAQRSLRLFALRESVSAAERALALAEAHPAAADAATRVRLHERLGDAHVQDGRSAEAVAAFESALAGARALGDAGWARDLLTKLGMAYRRADDYARAVDCLGQSLAVSRSLDDAPHVADTLYHLGTVAWSDSDNTLALRCHREAVQLCETHRLGGQVAMQAWHGLGEALFAAGEPREAMGRFERSLNLARELGDRAYEAENIMMLGWCCTGAMGVADYALASDHAERGLAVAQAAQQEWHLSPLRILQADAWRCADNVPSALELLSTELARIEPLGQVRFCIIALDVLGRLHLEQGRPDAAQQCFMRALRMGVDRHVHFWRTQIEAGLALARLEQGEPLDREDLARSGETALAHSEGCAHARCLQVLAEGALRAGQFATARDDAGQLLARATRCGLRELSAHACWQLGRGWMDESPQRARRHLMQARDEAEKIRRPWLARQVREALAGL